MGSIFPYATEGISALCDGVEQNQIYLSIAEREHNQETNVS